MTLNNPLCIPPRPLQVAVSGAKTCIQLAHDEAILRHVYRFANSTHWEDHFWFRRRANA